MSNSESEIKETLPLLPPSEEEPNIKDELSLILELIWLLVTIPLPVLWALYRGIFPPRETSLHGQVAMVTGAGRGLGRGLALALAREGCVVAVVDVNLASAQETADQICEGGGKAKAYFANVAKTQDIRTLRDAIYKDFGPVDLLVHNAGLIYAEPVEACTEAAVSGMISVNLLSHFWMAREFLPAMRERNSGHIVAIAAAASFAPLANASAYVASKFGLRGFMEVLRMELEAKPGNKIKTTTVFPYFINTSAHYMQFWDLRVPALSINDVVSATVLAIKRGEQTVTVPTPLYYVSHLRWLLPQYVRDKIVEIVYTRIIIPPKELLQQSPTSAIIRDLARNQ